MGRKKIKLEGASNGANISFLYVLKLAIKRKRWADPFGELKFHLHFQITWSFPYYSTQ